MSSQGLLYKLYTECLVTCRANPLCAYGDCPTIVAFLCDVCHKEMLVQAAKPICRAYPLPLQCCFKGSCVLASFEKIATIFQEYTHGDAPQVLTQATADLQATKLQVNDSDSDEDNPMLIDECISEHLEECKEGDQSNPHQPVYLDDQTKIHCSPQY